MTVTAELVSENRDLKAKLSQSESKLSQSETQRQSLEAQFEAKSEQFEKEALRFKLRAEYYEAQYESVIQSLRQAQREKFASTSERFEYSAMVCQTSNFRKAHPNGLVKTCKRTPPRNVNVFNISTDWFGPI